MNRLAAAFAILIAASTPALAQPDPLDRQPTFDEAVPPPEGAPITADDWLRVGLARYDAGDWKGAVDAFEMGNKLDPRPQFLFAIAQAERRRGNCKSASEYYTKFLASSPPIEQADAAREQLHKCEGAVVATATPPPPVPAPVVVIERPIVRAAPTRSWLHDPLTDGLAAGSVAFAAVGAGFWIAGNGAASQAAGADTYARHAQLEARAQARDRDAAILGAIAVAAGGVATWRILHHGRWTREHLVRVSPGPGTGLALGGSF